MTTKQKKKPIKKKPVAKKASTKKTSVKKSVKKKTPEKPSSENLPIDGGIVIVDEDIAFDRAQDNEMRRAYLEEHRSQEASD